MDAFERRYKSHGVNVTSEEEFEEEPVENIGAKLARQVAAKTSDLAGHSVDLAQGFIDECVKVVAAGANPVLISKGIDKTAKALVRELNLMSKGSNAGNDNEAGSIIAEAKSKVGSNGVIIDEGESAENSVYVVEGMQFEPGYMSPYFITEQERMCVEYYNCKVTNVRDPDGVLEDEIEDGSPILIIAQDFEQEPLDTLIVRKIRGKWDVAPVKAPDSGELKSQYLDDIAIITGATLIREEDGVSLDKAGKEVLGNAYKVVITKEMTTIVGDGTTKEAVNKRVVEIKCLIEQAEQDTEKETLNERLAKLSGGVAVIQVGGETETERREKMLRFDEALNGTKAAAEESIVVGGGCTLLGLAAKVDPIKDTLENEEEKAGADIVKKGLSNAGEDGSVVSEKVVKRSLEQAASAAKTFLMSEIKVLGAGNPMDISGWLLR